MNVIDLNEIAVRCVASDPLAVARTDIVSGTRIRTGSGELCVNAFIPRGQRVAIEDIPAGEFVRQYGQPFCRSLGIKAGELISNANTENVVPAVDWQRYQAPARTSLDPSFSGKTFCGFRRPDGRAGTRNHYLIIPASMCASETALQVARELDECRFLSWRYSHVDDIVAIPHSEGCGCDSGLPIERLLKVLRGYVTHPNVGGCLIMDMGCEQTDCDRVQAFLKEVTDSSLKPIDWVSIQKSGGTASAKSAARKIVLKRLPEVNRARRTPIPIAGLVVGVECGASDAFSGLTANPAIGGVVDRLVKAGGRAVLTEVTELVGIMPMLLNRFRTIDLARKFQGFIDWYEELARRMGTTLVPNLVLKNIEGGLMNNAVKSLGAATKGGTTAIEDVVDYAEPVMKKGLSIMQGPGNDPESVTGLVAGGANIVLFSTGHGTTTGDAIVPVIKVASTHETFRKLPKDMDVDAGRALDPGVSLDRLSDELLDRVIDVASGRRTWSERWKQRQFQVWTAGKLSL